MVSNNGCIEKKMPLHVVLEIAAWIYGKNYLLIGKKCSLILCRTTSSDIFIKLILLVL